jgi:hypothetical protein
MNPDILDKILRAIIVFLQVEKLGCTNSSWKRVRYSALVGMLFLHCFFPKLTTLVVSLLSEEIAIEFQREGCLDYSSIERLLDYREEGAKSASCSTIGYDL